MQPAMEKIVSKIQEEVVNTQDHKVKVTPKLAGDLLALQDPNANRKLDMGNVQRLAKLIEDGKWNEDVGSILVAKNGRLIDGQHRLRAIIESGKSITVTVRFGVDENAIKYVDTGKKRTTGQTLAIMGKRMPAIQLATANLLAYFERMVESEEPMTIAPRNLVLDPDSVVEIQERYGKELESMGSILFEHGAACVYAPLVFAAKKFPDAAHTALTFIKEGQVTNKVLERFHPGQKRLLRKGLGSGSERAETILFVFDLVKAIAEKKAPKALTKLRTDAKTHTDLVQFFSKNVRAVN
jgi:hypothetical protein